MMSRPDSPIKQTFKKLLSPSKPKPPPALTPQPPSEHTNWPYPESTSSSNYSSHSQQSPTGVHGECTGWNVVDSPQQANFGSNKENVHVTPAKDVVEKVMGPSIHNKLSKRNMKNKSKVGADGDLDREFEELMVHKQYYSD
jgi:hypothetical protein